MHALVGFYKKTEANTLTVKIAHEIGGAASLGAEDDQSQVNRRTPDDTASYNTDRYLPLLTERSGDGEEQDISVAEAQFKARVQLLYDGATDKGRIPLCASRLRDYVHLLGIRGTDEAQVRDVKP